MKKVCILMEGNRKSSIYETDTGYMVLNIIGENASRSYGSKTYKRFNGASKYADKFLLEK